LFAVVGALAALVFQFVTSDSSLAGSYQGFFYVWIVSCFFWGAFRGKYIRRSKDTESMFEAVVRAVLLFAGALCTSMVGSYIVEGVRLAIKGDSVGGLLKILMALPYGPLVGILACFYTIWLLVPAGVIVAAVLFRSGEDRVPR